MAGVDPRTGTFVTGWDHTLVCVRRLFTTRIGSRERRRLVGSAVPQLLGQNIDEPTIFRYRLAVVTALKMWELRVNVVSFDTLEGDNQPDALRAGRFAQAIRCQFRPRAYLGDFTAEPGLRSIFVGSGGVENGVLVL